MKAQPGHPSIARQGQTQHPYGASPIHVHLSETRELTGAPAGRRRWGTITQCYTQAGHTEAGKNASSRTGLKIH